MNKKMGVINITPDSFSDGNEYNQQDRFAKKFQEISRWADIIDIGAESTAPFNSSISIDQELSRFREIFYPYLDDHDDPQITLSIDTYKIAVFKEVALKVKSQWPATKFIFNDVSGKVDKELKKFIKDAPLDFTYVLSHNLAPVREKTQEHMNFVNEQADSEFFNSLINHFEKSIEELTKLNQSFIVDPCFGFSKSRHQNHFLIKNFKTLLLHFPYNVTFIYGVSRNCLLYTSPSPRD